MSAGTFEFDDRGRKLFKPNVPSFPALEEVHDLLDPAMASIREFDRRLGAWNRDAAVRDLRGVPLVTSRARLAVKWFRAPQANEIIGFCCNGAEG
jgi:hypothetical protein